MDVTGDRSKVQCCKEQYCIGTWNVRSMNQDKLEVVKQEMARVNIYILGINELKWNGMGDFNSDDHYIYYYGRESLRRNGVAIIVNKNVRNAVPGCNLKSDRMICLFPRQTIQYPIILPFQTVHGVLEARILKWFAIPYSSGPHSVRPLHHAPLKSMPQPVMLKKLKLNGSM